MAIILLRCGYDGKTVPIRILFSARKRFRYSGMRWLFVLLIAAVLPCAADDPLMQRYVPASGSADMLQALRIRAGQEVPAQLAVRGYDPPGATAHSANAAAGGLAAGH